MEVKTYKRLFLYGALDIPLLLLAGPGTRIPLEYAAKKQKSVYLRFSLIYYFANIYNLPANMFYQLVEEEGESMNVIVYHPESTENILELQRRVAMVHAEAALKYISKLTCPKEQKFKMINELKKKGLP